MGCFLTLSERFCIVVIKERVMQVGSVLSTAVGADVEDTCVDAEPVEVPAYFLCDEGLAACRQADQLHPVKGEGGACDADDLVGT
jgi:hypothetical protein